MTNLERREDQAMGFLLFCGCSLHNKEHMAWSNGHSCRSNTQARAILFCWENASCFDVEILTLLKSNSLLVNHFCCKISPKSAFLVLQKSPYPLVMTKSLRHWSHGPVEIVDFPINSMVIFQFVMQTFTRPGISRVPQPQPPEARSAKRLDAATPSCFVDYVRWMICGFP